MNISSEFDAFSSALRDVSQRRRNGKLRCEYVEGITTLYFKGGKLIGCTDSGINLVESLAQKLIFSEVALPELNKYLDDGCETFSELFLTITTEGLWNGRLIEEQLFAIYVEQHILNLVYKVVEKHNMVYQFEQAVCEDFDTFVPTVSIGQILLDIVACSEDRDRFNQIFAKDTILQIDPELEEQLNELSLREVEIVRGIKNGGNSLRVLQSKSLLSALGFQQILLDLYNRKIVQVLSADVSTSVTKTISDISAQFSDIEGSIDRLFDDGFDDPLFKELNNVKDVSAVETVSLDDDEQITPEPNIFLSKNKVFLEQISKSDPDDLLQSPFIVNIVIVVLLIGAVILPVWFWEPIIGVF